MFAVDRSLLNEIAIAAANNEDMERFKGRSSLRLIQSISTLPSAFPNNLNTCGRITVHQSGRFVIVSNRGHQSIAIFRVRTKSPRRGHLQAVGYFHTRGETPRHFQFDSSGQHLIVANQDSDSIAVFTFNLSSGEIKYTGNEYRVPSPNFVCCCPSYIEYPLSDVPSDTEESPLAADYDLSSEESTTPTDVGAAETLKSELAKAREEIEELKQKLASLTNE